MKRAIRRAILLIDHGSRRQEANATLLGVAELVRRQRPDVHVEIAHMELAEPNIQQGFAACVEAGAEEIVVHPYMLSPGRHATSDIPTLVAAAAERYPEVRYGVSAPLGLHPLMADVILDRVEETDLRSVDDQLPCAE